jgi:hypothetical protein
MLLAYSAVHRSALLGNPMPEKRIYLYINKAIPGLQQTLSSSSHQVPMATIAVTVMMASMGYMFWLTPCSNCAFKCFMAHTSQSGKEAHQIILVLETLHA